MDPTLKSRLIGAAVLIVLAAIVLPILLSSKPQPQEISQTRALEIPPAPDPDMSQVTLPLGTAVPEDDRVVTIDTSQPEPSPTGPGGASEALETPAPDAAAPSVPEQEPVATAPAPEAPAASAPAPAVATTPEGRFWVSLGGYGQEANANRVRTAARARGFQVESETVGSLTRLRTGPYASRSQAEQARQQLLAAIPDARPEVVDTGAVPTADAPAASAPAAGQPERAGAWAVQVGSFGQEANAQQLSERLRGADYPAFVERRGSSWAVRVGPYVRRTEAEAQRQRLRSGQQLADAIVVSHSD